MPTLDEVEDEVVDFEVEQIRESKRRGSYHEPLPNSLAVSDEEKTNLGAGHRKNEVHDPVVFPGIRVDSTAFRPARSLAPDESTMLGCALGDEESYAIRDAWLPSLKIVSWSAARYDSATNANLTVCVPYLANFALDK
jgi:hypothetical protein